MSDCDAVNPLDRDFIQSWERMEEFFAGCWRVSLGKIGSFSLLPNFDRLDTIESCGLDKRSTSSSCRARAITDCVLTSPVLPSTFIRTGWMW